MLDSATASIVVAIKLQQFFNYDDRNFSVVFQLNGSVHLFR